jgi:hypothetical protein
MRAAVLGQAGFMNYWLCLAILAAGAGLLMLLSSYLFKTKLDCV